MTPPPEQRRHDAEVFEQCLAELRAGCADPTLGLFGPGSWMWRVFREVLLVASGGRGILLQIAHPAVAAAGIQNSNFQQDLIGRARRTFASVSEWIFGDLELAIETARRIHGLHSHVSGIIPPEASPRAPGQPYRALDPELLLWVWATLVDTGLDMYERLLAPLSPAEREDYYQESRRWALLMGVPTARTPADWTDYRAWWAATLDGLEVGPAARDMARSLFHSPYAPSRWDEILTAGLLPPSLRDAYDLHLGPDDYRRFLAAMDLLREVLPRLPASLRYYPAWHQARVRVGEAGQAPAGLQSWLVQAVDAVVGLPLSLPDGPLPEPHDLLPWLLRALGD